jgi:hypothetical protein
MLLERLHIPSPVALRSVVANCADLSHKGRGTAALMLPDAWDLRLSIHYTRANVSKPALVKNQKVTKF